MQFPAKVELHLLRSIANAHIDDERANQRAREHYNVAVALLDDTADENLLRLRDEATGLLAAGNNTDS